MYHYTDGGLRNVWLKNGYTERSTPYGEAVAFADVQGLTRAICLGLIGNRHKLSGTELRYLRNAMRLSQPSLGQLLGVSGQSVAIWEKSGRVPKMADIAMRAIYTAHADGDAQVKSIVFALNEAERCILVLQETARGWTASTEPTHGVA